MDRTDLCTVYSDERGYLFELFQAFDDDIEMAYTVSTNPGFGRDIDRWHVHYFKKEIFICVYGEISIAVWEDGDLEVYELHAGDGVRVLVPREAYHSVANFSDDEAVLVVFCDEEYDPEDEHREPMRHWSWNEWLKQKT